MRASKSRVPLVSPPFPPPQLHILSNHYLYEHSLRVNTSTLASLREKLFTLWGDLEEHKASRVARAEQLRSRRPGDKPPLEDSDGEEGAVENTAAPLESKISNKPFTCCIRQYGVVVDEADPWRADAGDGKRWERVFGLFGTKIC